MAYLDGELALDRAGIASEHLKACPSCQELASEFQSVSRQLIAWQVEAHEIVIRPDLADLVSRHKQSTVLASVNRSVRRFSWAWGWALAALLIVAILLPRMTSHRQYWVTSTTSDFVRTNGPLIVRSAELALTTREFDKARNGIDAILHKHQGFLGKLNVSAIPGSGRTLDATLRIPADQREAVQSDLRKLGRVESEVQTGEDITAQYVDLDARLTNARNTEQRLTELLRQRTGKLSDVLEVEREIERVRGEIERQEAEKKNLAQRVEFASVNVRVREEIVRSDSVLDRLRNSAAEGYHIAVDGLIAAAVFLLSYGPSILILVAVLFVPARLIWVRWHGKGA